MQSQPFWQRLAQAPHSFGFLQLMRRVEGLHPHLPRLGTALRPSDEPLRLGQRPSLAFAPASVVEAEAPSEPSAPPSVRVAFFGAFGPHGALPLHLTEQAVQRELRLGDRTLPRFVDIFHHRLLLLFYRAWAQAHPAASAARVSDDSFGRQLASLAGVAHLDPRDEWRRVRVAAASVLHGAIATADALRAVLMREFSLRVRVLPFTGRWMLVPEGERTRLRSLRGGRAPQGVSLGRDAVLGSRVWDTQHHVHLVAEHVEESALSDLLRGGKAHRPLVQLLDDCTGAGLEWSLDFELRPGAAPAQGRLDNRSRLGQDMWLCARQGKQISVRRVPLRAVRAIEEEFERDV